MNVHVCKHLSVYLFLCTGRVLHEVSLDESIRYSVGDDIEQWLNGLLCLDVTNVPRISSGCPLPQDCDLYPLCIKHDLISV